MRKYVFGVVVTTLLISDVFGIDGVEYLKNSDLFESVSVTQTNLSLMFAPPPPLRSAVRQGDGGFRDISEYITNGKAWVLTPDQTARISFMDHAFLDFTPVSFKNQQKGFKILKTSYWFPGPTVTNAIAYLALSDTPVEVGEDDVEMIMEKGEWVKYGKPQPETEKSKTTSPVKRGEATAFLSSHDREQGNAPSKPNSLWLYVAISLCLLSATLYFLRRKLKT